MRSTVRFRVSSMSMSKIPYLALSAGIDVALIQPPFAYALKSSPGATDLSIPGKSISPREDDLAVLHAGMNHDAATTSRATNKEIESVFFIRFPIGLGEHLQTGHRWPLQNQPT